MASRSTGASAGHSTMAPAHTITAGAAKPKSRLPLAAGLAGVLLAGGGAAYFALAPGKPSAPVTATTPSVPPTPVSVTPPAAPNPDEAAEREARDAENRTEYDLAQVKGALERGNLERARDELRVVQRRIDEALQKRPRHAGLERMRAQASATEADLGRRIAARVKELTDTAEREAARNYDEAQRLIAEAERLDPAAAKPARERIEQSRRRSADDKSRAEDEKRRAEEEKRRAEEEKRRQEEARKARDARVELHVSLARYHFEQARTASAQIRYAEARRMAEQADIQLRRAMEAHASDAKPGAEKDMPPLIKAMRRELDEFERDLAKRIPARMAALLFKARANIMVGNLDAAAKELEEAAELEPASSELAASRRELDEARKKPQAPPDPDAAERERTRSIVRDPVYDGRGRRGAIYFAFGSGSLTPPLLQTLVRAADAARGDANSHLILLCSYDQLEAKDAAEGRKLAQERCEAAQRAVTQRGLPGARIRAGLSAPGKGPDFRRVSFAVQVEKQPETAKAPEKPPEATKPPEPGKAGAFQLAGRSARLSRISSERRAVMRIELQFGAGGALGVSCSAESADGGQVACYGQRSGTGRWTLNGTTLCISTPVLNLPGNACYEVSGAGNQLRLAGGGILAGSMNLQ